MKHQSLSQAQKKEKEVQVHRTMSVDHLQAGSPHYRVQRLCKPSSKQSPGMMEKETFKSYWTSLTRWMTMSTPRDGAHYNGHHDNDEAHRNSKSFMEAS